MKKSILLTAMMLTTAILFSQEYTASNEITYHVGDTITLGMGSNPDGSFKYVQMSGAKALLMYDQNSSTSLNAPRDLAGLRFVIKKIKVVKYMGNRIPMFYLERNFALTVENAIKSGELL